MGMLDGLLGQVLQGMSQQGGQAGLPDASRGMPGMGALGGLEGMLDVCTVDEDAGDHAAVTGGGPVGHR